MNIRVKDKTGNVYTIEKIVESEQINVPAFGHSNQYITQNRFNYILEDGTELNPSKNESIFYPKDTTDKREFLKIDRSHTQS